MKKFCFLVQARKDDDYFSSLESEDSDCIILSFREQLKNRKNSIYRPNTSWSQGRNMLLEEAYKTQKKYEYYIFMDDDARIVVKNSNMKDGLQKFKETLLQNRPAIGFPDYFWHLRDTSEHNRFSTQEIRSKSFNSPMFFDACINAFHSSIIKEILPYQDKFDSINWWLSQEIMNHYISKFINNSVLQINELITINLLSEPYPKALGTGILNKGAEYIDNLLINDGETVLYPKNRLLEYENSFVPVEKLSISKLEIFTQNNEFEKFRNTFWNNIGDK